MHKACPTSLVEKTADWQGNITDPKQNTTTIEPKLITKTIQYSYNSHANENQTLGNHVKLWEP